MIGQHITIFIFSLMLVFVLISCQHTGDDDDVPTIIQDRFWNYYERGIAYSLRGEWEKAASDFMVALGTKKGALYPEYNEKRRAKTYGVRFLDNYFPHRELGICYYFLGDFKESKKELEISLSMLPSARAKFYMNRVRSALFSQIPSKVPSPLSIDVEWAGDPLFINRPHLDLRGVVTSQFYVSEVRVNGERELFELAEPELAVDKRIELSLGEQPLRMTARDLAGNTARWEGKVVVDLEGPEISISPSTAQPNDAITVDISDNHGIQTLTIDGNPVRLPEGTRSHSLELPLQPLRKIRIEVQDKARNKTHFLRDSRDLRRASLDILRHHPDRRSAFYQNHADTDGLVVADVSSSSRPRVTKDGFPPIIRLQPDIPDRSYVTTDYYVLDVEIEDRGGIEGVILAVNANESLDEPSRTLCTHHRFHQTIELIDEVNSISITAKDRFGNAKSKTFEIIRKPPHKRIQKYRMTLATKLELAQELSKNQYLQQTTDFNQVVNDIIISGPKPRRFNIVERNEDAMAKFALEHTLARSPLKDYRLGVAAGKLKPAEWYLTGLISPRAGAKDENWEITGELTDVREGMVVTTSDTYFEGRSSEDVEFALQIFIHKFLQQLPLHSSEVGSKISRNKVIVPLGRADNIKQNFRFMFVSSEEVDSRFADPLVAEDGRWIQGIVTEVDDEECLLEIFPKGAIDTIEENDRVYMR